MNARKTENTGGGGNVTAALRKRREITAAAKRLFAEQGFAATTIRQIAARADLEGGSLYYHFPDKMEILFSILEDGNQQLLDLADRVLEADSGVPERLRELILGHVKILADDPTLFMVVVRELNQLSGPRRDRIMAQRKLYERMVQELLTAGIREGTLRAFDVKVVGFGLIALLNGVAFWFRPTGSATLEQVGEEYVRAFLGGLLA